MEDSVILNRAEQRHHHRVFGKPLHQALRWQLIAINPADDRVPAARATDEMAALDADQSARLLRAAAGWELEALLTTALFSGLRLGERLGLLWRDLDVEAGQARD